MKRLAPYACALALMACQPTADTETAPPVAKFSNFDSYPVYDGSDLGLSYSPERSVLKVWAPTATALKLRLYAQGSGGQPLEVFDCKRKDQGVWEAVMPGDRQGLYYTVQAQIGGEWKREVPDPYAKAVGANGNRAMILDLATARPEGWDQDARPPLAQFSDIVLYELHVRDASMHPQSGIAQKGKFLGLTELNTQGPQGVSTGLSHIRELGVTHVHLLPSFDFASIDEEQLERQVFNWGYDPKNYSVPEGSYATDPRNGAVRIREFRQLVKTFHGQGLRVVMDVVYNHTYALDTSLFNQLVPGYYYRQQADGAYSNASLCGNEVASERPMVRKFIVESLLHWVREYHIDGFRFDLMGIHDQATMRAIREALHAEEPSLFLYGEGWTASDSPLPKEQRALKQFTYQMPGIAAFSDDLRDGLKGAWHDTSTKGFASGSPDPAVREHVRYGIAGGIQHPQVQFPLMPDLPRAWAAQPVQTINYVSCHDNHTLWDRLLLSNATNSEAERLRMHLLCHVAVMTSQGVPFLHAGAEFLRTKGGEDNTYNRPDHVNQLDWGRKAAYRKTTDFFRQLIALRRNHPAFRMATAEQVMANLRFLDEAPQPHLIAYALNGKACGDGWAEIMVFLNGGGEEIKVEIPKESWQVVLEGDKIDERGLRKHRRKKLEIPPYSAVILARTE